MKDTEAFYNRDPLNAGCKGLVFVGNKIVVYRRDTYTDKYPLKIDLPGGGPEGDETPFETFQREVKEEFDLSIVPEDIVYVKCWPSQVSPGKVAYFPVARLPFAAQGSIHLGNEGTEYMLMDLNDYLNLSEDEVAWPLLQGRARAYYVR
jgi:8-oxo-dGTP diphosphatase